MDIQRTGLLAMLGIVTYLLFLEWNSYTTEQVEPLPDRVSAAQISGETPTVNDTPPQNIPSSPALLGDSPSPLDSTTRSVNTQYVRVVSPLFDLTIDLNGGDVTQALLRQFPSSVDRPNDPIALLDSVDRVYFAQSGLVGPNGPDASPLGRPVYTASSDRVDVTEPTDVVLTTTTESGLTVNKVFQFDPDRYDVTVQHRIQNNSGSALTVAPFVQIKRDNSADPSIQNSMGMQAFLGFALQTVDERYRKIDFGDFETDADANALNLELRDARVTGGHLALLQHYFTTAWVPDPNQTHTYSFRRNDRGEYIGSVVSPEIIIEPQTTAITDAVLYVGPKDQDALEALSPGLELVVDYGWLWFIAQPLFWLLKFIQSYVSNWGLAIILVTILVKGAFFQLSATAYRSMAKMRKFTPEITRLRELYGDDRQRMSKEMMDLYKKEKINPLGGCLPILVQMPVFIALYWVLLESVELRQAPFILWITDLSVKDPYFILPLLMGVSMYIQTSLNPAPPDPMQAKIMKYMPVAFTFFFLWFPAGLVLYWVVNNILSIAQQWVITRAIERSQAT